MEQILAESQTESGFLPLLPIGGRTAGFSASRPYATSSPPVLCSQARGRLPHYWRIGRVGLTLAEYLAKTRKGEARIAGTFPIPSREQWSSLLADTRSVDSTSRGKIEKILQLEALGAEVLVVQADVAITSELKGAVAQAPNALAPFTV